MGRAFPDMTSRLPGAPYLFQKDQPERDRQPNPEDECDKQLFLLS
jgi:hypothetical protein